MVIKSFDVINMNMTSMQAATIVVVGNVDAGKSTLLGVLTKGVLDDGRGSSRSSITTIPHEKTTGRTSTMRFHYMINGENITTLVDLCGHEKYFKTTLFGIIGTNSHFAIVVIGANAGINGMCEEHMAVLITMRIPFMIVMTKIDMTPDNVIARTKANVTNFFNRGKGITSRNVIFVDNHPIPEMIQRTRSGEVLPVICVSSVTGFNIGYLMSFINEIKHPRYDDIYNYKRGLSDGGVKNTTLFRLDNIYFVEGIGSILSGNVDHGVISEKGTYYVGPQRGSSTFIQISVKTIQNCIREPTNRLVETESGSISFRVMKTNEKITKRSFYKGLIVTSDLTWAENFLCYGFTADIFVSRHSSNICEGYQTVIQMKTLCCSGYFMKINHFLDRDHNIIEKNTESGKACIRVKDIASIDFYFLNGKSIYSSVKQFVEIGSKFMFRDGITKGHGIVRSLIKEIPSGICVLDKKKRHARRNK